MVATLLPNPIKRKAKIPKELIYEVIDGQEFYYRGYKNVVKNKIDTESIKGYNFFQLLILNFLSNYFDANLPQNYISLIGEGGLHLSHGNNLSLDLIILDKKDIDYSDIQNKYLHFAPKVVIEVDTKAEMPTDISSDIYFTLKTQKMLDFGVEKVVWIFTNIRKIMIAEPNKPWLIVNWTDEIEVLSVKFVLLNLLKNEGFENL